MLKASSLTGRSTLREAEALLGRDNRWTDLDRSGREEEFRYYVSKLDEKERNVSECDNNKDNNNNNNNNNNFTKPLWNMSTRHVVFAIKKSVSNSRQFWMESV